MLQICVAKNCWILTSVEAHELDIEICDEQGDQLGNQLGK